MSSGLDYVQPCTYIAVSLSLFLTQACGGGSESAGKKKPFSFGGCSSNVLDSLEGFDWVHTWKKPDCISSL